MRVIDPQKILFRASANHLIMTESRGKSNAELYFEAETNAAKYRAKCEGNLKKDSPSYKADYNRLMKYNQELIDLAPVSNDASLSTTAQNYCRQLYKELTTGRRHDWGSKYTKKGNLVEEDGITLLSLETKELWTKNTERINNEFFTGLPDLYNGDNILKTKYGKDVKCSWDVFTFPDKFDKVLNPAYYWQDVTYMALTGAEKWTTSYCLVNAPGGMVQAEKWKLFQSLNAPVEGTEEFENYRLSAMQIERNMIFELDLFIKHNKHFDFESDLNEWRENGYDIPRNQRLKEYEVLRDDSEIKRLEKRVKDARNFIKNSLV